jgi:NitT/TauT family transport system permease protein
VPPIIFPSLEDTINALITSEPLLLQNLGVTLNEAIRGFILGNLIAIAVATVFVHSRNAERTLFPVAILIQTIPIVIYVPFLQIFFGTGQESKVIVSILISFFPTLVNMTKGFRAVDPNIRDLMRLLNASSVQVYWKLRWPSSLPYLFASLKITSTLCVIGAIVGEFFGSQAGIGYLLQQFVFQEDKADLMASVLLASAASMVFFLVMVLAERYLIPWAAD